jgi:hypothetical protein
MVGVITGSEWTEDSKLDDTASFGSTVSPILI